jgi:hypothetical protein
MKIPVFKRLIVYEQYGRYRGGVDPYDLAPLILDWMLLKDLKPREIHGRLLTFESLKGA